MVTRRKLSLLLLTSFVLVAWSCGKDEAPVSLVQTDRASAVPAEQPQDPRIVGGSPLDTTSPARTNLVALVSATVAGEETGQTFCSGALVAPRLVVTAAHCLDDVQTPLDVVFARQAMAISAPRRRVVRVEKFRKDVARFYPNFDVAWLLLDADAPASHRPIEILRDPERLSAQLKGLRPLLLAGYGKTSTLCSPLAANCLGEAREVQTRLRRFVNTAHFRQLLITGPTPGQGSCNGDSGGPAYAEINGRWYLAGVLHGKNYLLNSKQVLKPEQICESGESTYTFIGGYRDWLAQSSRQPLLLDAKSNPAAPAAPDVLPLSPKPSLLEYMLYDKPDSAEWMTATVLLNGFKDPLKRIDPNFDELITSPRQATDAMLRWDSFSANGITTTLPSLIPRDQQLSDIRPLALLKKLKKLELSNHRIVDTSPLAQLTQLEEIKLSNNFHFDSKVSIPWKLDFLHSLPKLRVLNLLANGKSLDLRDVPWLNLTRLETLILSNNAGVLDLYAVPWEKMTSLRQLVIMNSELKDISPLAAARTLEQLNLRRNQIRDISLLKSLENLRVLDVSENLIMDFAPVTGFDRLEKLLAIGNPSQSAPCPDGASCIYTSDVSPILSLDEKEE